MLHLPITYLLHYIRLVTDIVPYTDIFYNNEK